MAALAAILVSFVWLGGPDRTCAAQPTPAVPGSVSEGGIDRFAGVWVGKTTEATDVERKTTLTIDPTEGGGFTVTWTSFETPTRGDSGIIRRERHLEFVQTETTGLYRARGANDPVTDLAAWAHIAGDVLSVSTIAVLEDGRLEHQIYDRTLTDEGLFLSYRRYLNADLVRAIDAEFSRL